MKKAQRGGLLLHLFDVILNVIIIVAIVVGIRTFLVSPFQVEGSSMSDTLEHKEYIIINKLVFFVSRPQRGDVVVFRPPNDPQKYYVKRVIGIPGDTLSIRNGYVYLQTKESDELVRVDESYLNERNTGHTYRHPPTSGDTNEATFHVPEGRYFLMGDNRQGSLDSRSFASMGDQFSPYVPEEEIKGRVWFVALPVTKIHALEPPKYNL